MRSLTSVRVLGLAAVLGGLLWSVAFLYHASKPRGCVAEECATRPMRNSGVLDGVLMSLATALIVAGMVGLVLLVRRSRRMGAWGNLALVMAGAGLTVLFSAAVVQAVFFDGDFRYMPYFVIPGLAALVLGFLLLGITVLRSGVLPTWTAVLLMIGALAMIGANEQTGTALLFVPFGVAWMAVGHALWSASDGHGLVGAESKLST